LIGIIVVLLVLIVLAGFYTKIADSILKKADREICRASVLAQSITSLAPEGEEAVTPDCKTYSVVFFDDHVEINGKTAEVYDPRQNDYVKKFNGLTDDIVNRVVAEELRWCWYQFLEGKKSLFGLKNFFAWNSERACFLCSEISFDKSVTQDKFEEFYQYTKDTTMLKSEKQDSDLTYYSYYAEQPRRYGQYYDQYDDLNAWEEYATGMQSIISIIDTDKCEDYFYLVLFENRKPIEREIVFDTTPGKKYVVFFVREGKSSKPREVKGLFSDVPQGCAPETYFAYVLPSEKLSEQCSSLMRGSMK